jgi:hypothetical protein
MPLMDKIESFVVNYIELIKNNPHIPIFVLHELSRNPGFVQDIISHNQSIPFQSWLASVETAINKKEIIEVNPRHLLVNMISMCIFPFVGRPILQTLIFNHDTVAFEQFLDDRKTEVIEFIRNSIAFEPKS